MYSLLIAFHTYLRWLVIAALMYAIYRSGNGYLKGNAYSKKDDLARHWTATIAHIQLMIGITLYTQSPIIKCFWKNKKSAIHLFD